MSYSVTTAPAQEPITLSDAKEHLRVDYSDHDTLITALITVARRHVEQRLWRALITQSLTLTLRRFPTNGEPIRLPGGSVQSITSIAYVDANGDSQSLTLPDDIQTDLVSEPALIKPAYNTLWPGTRCQYAGVTIVYVAGFGDDPADVPPDIIHAQKLLIGSMFANREDYPAVPIGSVTESTAVDALLTPWQCHDRRLLESLE